MDITSRETEAQTSNSSSSPTPQSPETKNLGTSHNLVGRELCWARWRERAEQLGRRMLPPGGNRERRLQLDLDLRYLGVPHHAWKFGDHSTHHRQQPQSLSRLARQKICVAAAGGWSSESIHVSSTWGFGIPTLSPVQSDPKAQDRVGSGILQEVCGREKWVLLLVDGTRPAFMP